MKSMCKNCFSSVILKGLTDLNNIILKFLAQNSNFPYKS